MIDTWGVSHFFLAIAGGKTISKEIFWGAECFYILGPTQSSGIAALCVNGVFDSVRN